MNTTSHKMEVRAAEDGRLLGYLPPPRTPGPAVAFELSLGSLSPDTVVRRVTLHMAVYAEGSARWWAYKVPAAQWAEIKDRLA